MRGRQRQRGCTDRHDHGSDEKAEVTLVLQPGTLYLGVTVDGDPGELVPRFAIGSVPYSGYAEHAGDAASLQGLAAEDFALSTHNHSFASFVDIPSGLADGDNDLLASLSADPEGATAD